MTGLSKGSCVKLVIFDLDQTLVDVTWLHDETVHEVFRDFFGVDARLGEIDFAGKSITDNIIELAVLKGISRESTMQKINEILEAYDELFRRKLPRDASPHILSGARRLLDELSRTDNVLALYTGSSPGTAEMVLANTGLSKYFRFAVYGTKSKSRINMVELALERAEILTHRGFRGSEIVIIGDSVRDIDCSKHFGAVSIAVATGFHSKEELMSRQPDYLFGSLEEQQEILQAIESGCPVRQSDQRTEASSPSSHLQ